MNSLTKITPPYTGLLIEVIQKLQNSSSSLMLTWLPGTTSEGAAQKLSVLFAVHDCDDDDADDDDDDTDSFFITIIKT